jgi:hypothetical protein
MGATDPEITIAIAGRWRSNLVQAGRELLQSLELMSMIAR